MARVREKEKEKNTMINIHTVITIHFNRDVPAKYVSVVLWRFLNFLPFRLFYYKELGEGTENRREEMLCIAPLLPILAETCYYC
jgi:hypothetical protein